MVEEKKKRGRKSKIIKKKDKIEIKSDEVPIIAHINLNSEDLDDNTVTETTETLDTNSLFIKNEKELDDKIAITKYYKKKKFDIKTTSYDSNTKCWWCKNTFENPGVGLPNNYVKNKFQCQGHFCSFSCASAYNIDLNDELVSKRNSLLHLLYEKTFDEKKNINPSPHWLTLKEYGGVLSIEEFRENIIMNLDEFIYLHPPIICNMAVIERNEKKNMIINTKLNLKKDELVLKRSKPLKSTKYSLETTMGLKRKKKKT